AQWDLAVKINHDLTQAWAAVNQMLALQTQIAAIKTSAPASVREAGEALHGELHSVIYKISDLNNKTGEDPLNYPIMLDNKLADLGSRVEECTCAPQPLVHDVYTLLHGKLEAQLTAWHELQSKSVVAFNALLQQNNLKPLAVSPRP
ncbi:MAG: hypothetical protein ACRD1F_09875, partial [Terriglobales bacterium]